MREELNRQIVQGSVSGATFVPGNAGKDLFPLGWFLRKVNSTDPTVGGNVGNISGSSNSWWQHRTANIDGASVTGTSFSGTVTSYAGIKANFKRLYNFCARGSGGPPDLGLADQVTFETYENALDTQVRYTDTALADMGFDNIKLRGATLLWDEQVPDIDNGTVAVTEGTLFLINSKFYKLVIDSETDVVTTPLH